MKNTELAEGCVVEFNEFKEDIIFQEMDEVSIRIIYLIAIEGLPLGEVAKLIGKSKQHVVDTAKNLSELIINSRMEHRLKQLKAIGATKRELFFAKGQLYAEAIRELENRARSGQLADMSIEKLLALIETLSNSLDLSVVHPTSHTESFIDSLEFNPEKQVTYVEKGE